MFSVRTTLVVAAFVAAGLSSAAEYLVRVAQADHSPFKAVQTDSTVYTAPIEVSRDAPMFAPIRAGSPWV